MLLQTPAPRPGGPIQVEDVVVNRSVITGTIAAVVLSAGAAMAAAAPAVADPPGPGTVADAGSPDAGSRGDDRTEGTRKRGQALTLPTTAEPGSATKEPWPCPWPTVVPPAPAPAPAPALLPVVSVKTPFHSIQYSLPRQSYFHS